MHALAEEQSPDLYSHGDGSPEMGNPDVQLLDPADLASRILTRRMLETRPELGDALGRAGLAYTIEVPDPSWIAPLARTLKAYVAEPAWLAESDGHFGIAQRHIWILLDGSNKDHRPDVRNEEVVEALGVGESVIGIASNPRKYLPAALFDAADYRIAMPALEPADLRDLAKQLTGEALPDAADLSFVRFANASDLRLARRPFENAEKFTHRLQALITARLPRPTLTLDQLPGMDEATAWGADLASDLTAYRQGRLGWEDVDKGVLLVGPPGTGKTTYAQALAGSCGVPLIAASLAQWQSAGHLGDLLREMRSTFQQARSSAPVILFLDEVDSFGDRTKFRHENRNYSNQVVNALLECLDGVAGRPGVVVVGATNNAAAIDPAIRRSGRLDRSIQIPLPDVRALKRILRFHLRDDLEDQDLSAIADLAAGKTGADCERFVRSARRHARKAGRPMVLDDLEAAARGNVNPLSQKARHRCAIHEAGHAIACAIHDPQSVIKVTLQQTPETAGGVFHWATLDSTGTAREIEFVLVELLAGRAAEEVILGAPSAGAGGGEESDLAKATLLATNSVAALGLFTAGLPPWLGMVESRDLPRFLAAHPALDLEVAEILSAAYRRSRDLIRENRDLVLELAELLERHETVSGEQVAMLLAR